MSNYWGIGDLFIKKKIEKNQCRKNERDFSTSILLQNSRPVLYVTQETFLVQFLGPTGTIWRLLEILYNFWGRTILVTSGVSKKNSD